MWSGKSRVKVRSYLNWIWLQINCAERGTNCLWNSDNLTIIMNLLLAIFRKKELKLKLITDDTYNCSEAKQSLLPCTQWSNPESKSPWMSSITTATSIRTVTEHLLSCLLLSQTVANTKWKVLCRNGFKTRWNLNKLGNKELA